MTTFVIIRYQTISTGSISVNTLSSTSADCVHNVSSVFLIKVPSYKYKVLIASESISLFLSLSLSLSLIHTHTHTHTHTYIYIYIYEVHTISLPTFFVWAFKIVVDSWKYSMLLLYILWDDWPIFMISGLMNSYSNNWNTPN